MPSSPSDSPLPRKPTPAPPLSIRYLGFSCTGAGRAYRLRVEGRGEEPREFTITIPSGAFESRRARYQDAPDVCFARLLRELTANAELPASELLITPAELDDYRDAQLKKSPDRKLRTARTWP
jgi:hypothetical protein